MTLGISAEDPSESSRRYSLRVIAASIGLVGVVFAETLPQGSIQSASADIGFVGLGHMGAGIALNLLKAC